MSGFLTLERYIDDISARSFDDAYGFLIERGLKPDDALSMVRMVKDVPEGDVVAGDIDAGDAVIVDGSDGGRPLSDRTAYEGE